MPYKIMFGKNSRVNISNLPINPSLIHTLHLEVKLCALLKVKDSGLIADVIIESYAVTRYHTEKIIERVGDELSDINSTSITLPHIASTINIYALPLKKSQLFLPWHHPIFLLLPFLAMTYLHPPSLLRMCL